VVDRFYEDVVGEYWPPERRYVEQAYRTLPFPWAEERPPPFQLVTEWSLELAMGYFASWSSVQRFKDAHAGPRVQARHALACRQHASSQLAGALAAWASLIPL